MEFRVFISYSRKDLHLIEPVVDLLRATRDMVFHDVDTIRPGKRWRAQLDEALVDTNLLVVFWCRHAAGSKYVREEYEAAMAKGKDVLPLLIDDTPLPPSLADFQCIDFRTSIGSSHAYRRRALIGGVVFAVLLAGSAGAYWATRPEVATTIAAAGERDTVAVPSGMDMDTSYVAYPQRPHRPPVVAPSSAGDLRPMDTSALALDTLPMRPPGPPDRPDPDTAAVAAATDTAAPVDSAVPMPPDPGPSQPGPADPDPGGQEPASRRGLPVVLLLLAAAVLSLVAAFVALRRTPPKLRERQERIAEELRDVLERRRGIEA
jgi:hypothetical protein